MRIEVVGKNGFVVTDAIRSYCEKKLQKITHVLGDEFVTEMRVVCKVYKDHHKVEITIPTKVLILRAEVNNKDMYAAVDLSVDKLLSQVRKMKNKMNKKFEREGIKGYFKSEFDADDLNAEVVDASEIVKNKKIDLVPMSVDDALAQMELLNHRFFVFLNAETNKVNVCYIRDDGNYSIIETNHE
jgi:putative sigma-54 modulation protein